MTFDKCFSFLDDLEVDQNHVHVHEIVKVEENIQVVMNIAIEKKNVIVIEIHLMYFCFSRIKLVKILFGC